jgi:hypothetical protein
MIKIVNKKSTSLNTNNKNIDGKMGKIKNP